VFIVETDASSSQTLSQLLTVYKLRSRVKLVARNLEVNHPVHELSFLKSFEADYNSFVF
jgi:folate-binding Fe-S cluster repair protein YgfZ